MNDKPETLKDAIDLLRKVYYLYRSEDDDAISSIGELLELNGFSYNDLTGMKDEDLGL